MANVFTQGDLVTKLIDLKRNLQIYLDVEAAAAAAEAAVEILRRRSQLPRPGRWSPGDHSSSKRI